MESPAASNLSSPAPSPGPLSPQEQARLRRERRQAKLQAGGAARLNKITSLSGRPEEPAAPAGSKPESIPAEAVTPVLSPTTEKLADDPEEVDISQHFYNSRGETPGFQQSQMAQQDLFRQMLLGMESDSSGRQSPNVQGNTSMGGHANIQGQKAEVQDPMVQMLQQLMGGDDNSGDAKGALPSGLASMLGVQQDQQQPKPNKYGYLWRIIHAVFALALGVYIVTATPFSGSHFSRSESFEGDVGVKFFWIFATVELLLQSSRFFLEKGQLPTTGILGGLGSMLPEPYAGYLRVLNRYSVIYTTIVGDAMVIVFVLGSVAWWKGLVN